MSGSFRALVPWTDLDLISDRWSEMHAGPMQLALPLKFCPSVSKLCSQQVELFVKQNWIIVIDWMLGNVV